MRRKEAEAGGKTTDLFRLHGISEQTFYQWKAKYGGLEVNEARRLRQLEYENTRLKRRVADLTLDKLASRNHLRSRASKLHHSATTAHARDCRARDPPVLRRNHQVPWLARLGSQRRPVRIQQLTEHPTYRALRGALLAKERQHRIWPGRPEGDGEPVDH
jgi:putative transposase